MKRLLLAITLLFLQCGCTSIDQTVTTTTTPITASTTAPTEIITTTDTHSSTIPETEAIADTTTEATTKATTEAITETVTEAVPEAPPVYGEYAVIGESGILVTLRNGHYTGIMPCWGTLTACLSYAEGLNTFSQKLPDVNVYSMVIPTSSEFYTPKEFSSFTASQATRIDHVADNLVGVTPIDAHSALLTHINEPLYSRTDHHWFPLGGYYAAEEFAHTADFPFPPLEEYEKVTKGGYVGSLYNYSKDEHLYNDPEDFTLYIPKNEYTTTYYDTAFNNPRSGYLFPTPDGSAYYCSFLGADNLIAKIETDANTGRKLVIFKESYGNALVPFLTHGFDEIYVCDIRYFDKNAISFCDSVGATDLLFAVCTFTPAGVNGKYVHEIIKN